MKHINNPYHVHQMDAPFNGNESQPLLTLREGWQHEVGEFVNLELTAEQMVQDELSLVKSYIADDGSHFWHQLKDEMVQLELTAGEVLLSAADPTRVEWQLNHWWGDDETQFH